MHMSGLTLFIVRGSLSWFIVVIHDYFQFRILSKFKLRIIRLIEMLLNCRRHIITIKKNTEVSFKIMLLIINWLESHKESGAKQVENSVQNQWLDLIELKIFFLSTNDINFCGILILLHYNSMTCLIYEL